MKLRIHKLQDFKINNLVSTKLIILAISIIFFYSCKKNDDDQPVNPIDQLPPATQTGANTFGCLLDGEPFLPGAGLNPLDCVYQFTNGGYYFALQANREINQQLYGIGILTDSLQISQGETFLLNSNMEGNASGGIFINSSWNYTTLNYNGELVISRLDEINNIVSGTFFFDVEDQNGVIHEIRDGRFDMQFSQ